jgi:hypothetical protein
MYPLGHFALGYFSGMIIGKFTREEVNIPIIWLISILPDVDIFFPFIEHRVQPTALSSLYYCRCPYY